MASSILPYHLSQLAAFCAEHPIDRKVVFVPSAQIGYNLGIALAESGTSWVNLHLITPTMLAEQVAGPRLRADGWRPLVQDADLFFIQEQLRTLPGRELHPLVRGTTSLGLARTILRTLRALRSAGIDPGRLVSAGLRNGGWLRTVYTEYCAWMDSNRLFDRSRLFATATEMADPDRFSAYAVFDETRLDAGGAAFIRAISNGTLVRVGLSEVGRRLPQGCAGERFAGRPIVASGRGAVHPAASLLESTSDAPEHESTVRLREAVGEENEIKGLLREFLADGTAWDSIELAYTQEDVYLPLLVAAADQFGIPATFAAGVPVTGSSVGQALRSFYRWIARGYDPDELVRMCRSRLLETRSISPADLARIVEDVRMNRGRESYRERLDRHVAWLRAGIDHDGSRSAERREQRIEAVRRARKLLDGLYGLIPASGSGSVEVLCRAGIGFIKKFAPLNRTPRDTRAAESLRERLAELAECGHLPGATDELAGALVELVSSHKIEASVAKPGHLYVVPLDRAGYARRDHLAVVGLAETTFPGAYAEDPILLDDERQTLSQELVLERKRSGEAAWHLARAVGRAGGTITLVSNRRSIADGRETYPSAAYQQVKERLQGSARHWYLPVPEQSAGLSETELALAFRRVPGLREQLEFDRSWLADGRRAERARNAPEFGRYSGWLGRATPELRPGLARPVSVSRLETLATCPYRYFLRYVLGIRPPDEMLQEAHRWLTPLEFGSLLHDILRAFMEHIAARQERVDAERHAALLEEITTRKIEEMLERVPVRFETGYRADVNRLRRAVHIFLNEESGRDVDPVGFEVSFGMGAADGLNRPDAVHIQLSDSVQFALMGSIDRVDRGPDGYEIWDYKSGSTYDFDEQDLLMRGRRLQWALYAHALGSFLSEGDGAAEVSRAGYFFTNDREHGLRLSEKPPSRDELAATLEPLLDMVSHGAFLHVQKYEACKFCDYNAVCARERRTEDDLDEIPVGSPEERGFMDSLAQWMNV